MNFERPSYSVNEDEIKRMGKEKGLNDTEIDAQIASERAKMESANSAVSASVEEAAERAFGNQAEKDPLVGISAEKIRKLHEEELDSIPATPGTQLYAEEQIRKEAREKGWEDIDIGKGQEEKAA